MTLRAKVIFAFMLCIFITNLTTATLGYFQNKSSLINHLLNVELPVKITLEKTELMKQSPILLAQHKPLVIKLIFLIGLKMVLTQAEISY